MLFSKLILSLIAQTQIKLLTETFLISGKTNKQITVKEHRRFWMPGKKNQIINKNNNNNNQINCT